MLTGKDNVVTLQPGDMLMWDTDSFGNGSAVVLSDVNGKLARGRRLIPEPPNGVLRLVP